MFGSAMTNLFKQVEATLDPLDIFNPGKKVMRGLHAQAGDVDPFAHLDLPHD